MHYKHLVIKLFDDFIVQKKYCCLINKLVKPIKSIMNTFRINKFSLVIGLLLLSFGCTQDDPSPIDQVSDTSAIITGSTNPYSVEIMGLAIEELSNNTSFNPEGIEVHENYQYIQFDMPLEMEVEALEQLVDLYDYPALSGPDAGDEVTSSEPEAYYAIVPVTTTPPGSYQVLSSLYLPEVLETEAREDDLVLLEMKAYELAGWIDPTDAEENARIFGKWRPGGTIEGELVNGDIIPLQGIKVEIAKSGSVNPQRTCFTDAEGKFQWEGARPLALVRYKFSPEKYDRSNGDFSSNDKLFSVYVLDALERDYDLPFPYIKKTGSVPVFTKNLSKSQYNKTLNSSQTCFFFAYEQYELFKEVEDINLSHAPSFTMYDEQTDYWEEGMYEIAPTTNAPYELAWPTFQIVRALSYKEIYYNYDLNLDMRIQVANAVANHITMFATDVYVPFYYPYDPNHIQRVFLDLIDDNETPHPDGYSSEKDQVSGFTIKELLASLEGVTSFEDWKEVLIAGAETPEEAESLQLLLEEPVETE